MPYKKTLCLADSLFGFLGDLMAEGSKTEFCENQLPLPKNKILPPVSNFSV